MQVVLRPPASFVAEEGTEDLKLRAGKSTGTITGSAGTAPCSSSSRKQLGNRSERVYASVSHSTGGLPRAGEQASRRHSLKPLSSGFAPARRRASYSGRRSQTLRRYAFFLVLASGER